jgi:hypothetical protein
VCWHHQDVKKLTSSAALTRLRSLIISSRHKRHRFLLLVACCLAIYSKIPMDRPTITAALLQQNDKLHPLPQQIDALPLRAHIVSSQITYVV